MTIPIMADQGPLAEPLLTPPEVAAVFRVDPRTVGDWLRSGRLASIRTPGGHHRVRESAVRALLSEAAEVPA